MEYKPKEIMLRFSDVEEPRRDLIEFISTEKFTTQEREDEFSQMLREVCNIVVECEPRKFDVEIYHQPIEEKK